MWSRSKPKTFNDSFYLSITEAGRQQHNAQHGRMDQHMLEHTFMCATCKLRLERGEQVSMISPHHVRMGSAAINDGDTTSVTPDAVSVICPQCYAINVQCCQCSFTTSKDADAKNPRCLNSKKYQRHYSKCPARMHHGSGVDNNVHPNAEDLGGSADIDSTMDVSFEHHQDNDEEDDDIEVGGVEITEQDYVVATEYNDAVILSTV